MSPKFHFIVIDDSRLDCFIAEKVIKNSGKDLSVRSFSDAREALALIKEPGNSGAKTVLIVDIQMPLMNGFEFVEAFEKLPTEIRDKYIVYVLTSSSNQSDLNRMGSYFSVNKVLHKPLSSQTFTTLLNEFENTP